MTGKIADFKQQLPLVERESVRNAQLVREAKRLAADRVGISVDIEHRASQEDLEVLAKTRVMGPDELVGAKDSKIQGHVALWAEGSPATRALVAMGGLAAWGASQQRYHPEPPSARRPLAATSRSIVLRIVAAASAGSGSDARARAHTSAWA